MRGNAKSWTEMECAILDSYYPNEGKDVYRRLPGRTPVACAAKASKRGLAYKSRIRNNHPMWSAEGQQPHA